MTNFCYRIKKYIYIIQGSFNPFWYIEKHTNRRDKKMLSIDSLEDLYTVFSWGRDDSWNVISTHGNSYKLVTRRENKVRVLSVRARLEIR